MRRPRVLIVDDDTGTRYVFRRIIESDVEVVDEAANGREAVEAVEMLRPDVILLDISMPVMDGFAAAAVIRERMPDVQIIFVSDHADNRYIEEAFRLGARGFVAKHAANLDLVEAIQVVVTGSFFQPAPADT